MLAEAITQRGGNEAVSLKIAEQYLDSFGQIAKAGTTMLLPASAHDPASMVASALSIYKQVSSSNGGGDGGSGGPAAGGGSGGSSIPVRAAPTAPSRPAAQAREQPAPAAAAAGAGTAHSPKFSLQRILE
jgi:hypothetical protein